MTKQKTKIEEEIEFLGAMIYDLEKHINTIMSRIKKLKKMEEEKNGNKNI